MAVKFPGTRRSLLVFEDWKRPRAGSLSLEPSVYYEGVLCCVQGRSSVAEAAIRGYCAGGQEHKLAPRRPPKGRCRGPRDSFMGNSWRACVISARFYLSVGWVGGEPMVTRAHLLTVLQRVSRVQVDRCTVDYSNTKAQTNKNGACQRPITPSFVREVVGAEERVGNSSILSLFWWWKQCQSKGVLFCSSN